MKTCYEAGTLRAYLDGELPATELSVISDHLADCAACETQLGELRALDERVHQMLFAVEPVEGELEVGAALASVRAHMAKAPVRGVGAVRARVMPTRRRRPAIAAAAVAAALLLVLLVPPLRTIGDSLLQVFRGQSVIFVSVPQSRLQQLRNLHVDANTLFISQPTEVGTAPAPQTVSTLQQASALLGFTPSAPSDLPSAPTATTYTVEGQTAYTMQINVQSLREVLAALGITDVTIPDALGARPISIILPPHILMHYQGAGYSVSLIEGTAPIVNLPPGVDLKQLGRAVLEVFGMSSSQAEALSNQIDWRSTLVFPFPLGTTRLQEVTVSGAQGVLLNAGSSGDTGPFGSGSSCQAPCPTSSGNQGQPNASPGDGSHTLIYWQKGSRFYILDAQGNVGKTVALAIANSVP